MPDNNVMEIYNRIYNFLESLSLKEKKVSLEELMDYKYGDFKTNLLDNIKVLCHDDREFLINEGYFRYGFYSDSFSFKWGIINAVNSLKTFSKNSDPLLTYHNLYNYIKYIKSQKNLLDDYNIHGRKSYRPKDEIEKFLNNEVDSDIMRNYDIYMEVLNKINGFDSRYKFIKEIPILVFSYLYINKLDIDFMTVYQAINIDEVFEYLYLNELVLKDDTFNCYYINSQYNEGEVLNVMYQYIIDNVFKKIINNKENTKELIKKKVKE